VLKICERASDQRLNRAKSPASTPSISAITMVGNGAAYSAIASNASRPLRASSSSLAMARMRGRKASTARWLNAWDTKQSILLKILGFLKYD